MDWSRVCCSQLAHCLLYGERVLCYGKFLEHLNIVRCTYFAGTIVRIATFVFNQPEEVIEEISWTSVALPSSSRVAVQICILTIVNTSAMILTAGELAGSSGLGDIGLYVLPQAIILR